MKEAGVWTAAGTDRVAETDHLIVLETDQTVGLETDLETAQETAQETDQETGLETDIVIGLGHGRGVVGEDQIVGIECRAGFLTDLIFFGWVINLNFKFQERQPTP